MKTLVDVRIKKLRRQNTYYAHVEFPNLEVGREVENEFTGETFREIWDKVTFFLLDFEHDIEDFVA